MTSMFDDAVRTMGLPLSGADTTVQSRIGLAYAAALDALKTVSGDAMSLAAHLPPPSGIGEVTLKTGNTVGFGFVVAPEVNAFAKPVAERDYVVGMFTGLPVVLRGIFTELVGNAFFLAAGRLALEESSAQTNGVPLTERYFRELAETRQWSVDRQQAYAAEVDALDASLSRNRRGVRDMLTFHALKFVWLHEIGHVAWGHCDHRRRQRGAAALFEHDITATSASAMTDSQILRMFKEVQADDFAAYELHKEPVAALVVELMDGDDPAEQHDYLLNHFVAGTVASYVLFMVRTLMNGRWSDPEELKVPFVDLLGNGAYPPDQVRALACLWGAGKVFADLRRKHPQHEATITGGLQNFTRHALDSLDDLASISPQFGLYRGFFRHHIFENTYDWAMTNHYGGRVDAAAELLRPFVNRDLLIATSL